MFHVKHFADEEEFMKAFVGRILLLVFLFSCASPVLKPEPEAGFIEEGVADLKEMPQNVLFYLKTTSLAKMNVRGGFSSLVQPFLKPNQVLFIYFF